MPRREQPLEGDDPLTVFAAELRVLRRRAGSQPYRRLARVAIYSSSTLAEAAGGRRLPSLAVTLAYVRACGGDDAQWRTRWHEVAAVLASGGTSADDPEPGLLEEDRCPYAGLSAFGPRDAARFFGRERLTEDLVARVRARRFVAVFGASGSGKSSLLRAGLLARLSAPAGEPGEDLLGVRGWPVLLFAPGAHPLDECAAQLAVLAGGSAAVLHRQLREDPRALHLAALQALVQRPQGTDLLVVVDQFEEAFSLCAEREREEFFDQLLTAAGEPNSRVRVVVGVRADYYPHFAPYPRLAEALHDAQVLVGPMSTEELRRAISSPAAASGCIVEGALLARIVADATGAPGALPLVSHALRETWRRRSGNTLTVGGYETAGGIHYALARSAEAAYRALTRDQQGLARGILLRLVALGEGAQDTKRPAARTEFDAIGTGAVLDALSRARLVTLDAYTVDLTHEALLTAWPRLHRWIDEDRAGLLIRQHLTDASATWHRGGLDQGDLYRGERLAAAATWADGEHDLPLDEHSRKFLAASTRHARRAGRLRRGAIAGLCALTLLAGGTATLALRSVAQARAQSAVALSRLLAAQSEALGQGRPVLADQLALAAWQTAPTDEAGAAMVALLEQQQRSILIARSGGPINVAAAFSPNGTLIAAASDPPSGTPDRSGTVQLWDPVTGLPAAAPIVLPAAASALGFSSDSKRLFISTRTLGPVLVWDVAARRFANTTALPASVLGGAPVENMVLSPGGRYLLTVGGDLRIWDTTTGSLAAPPIPRAGIGDQVFALSPDGAVLAGTGADGSVQMRDVATGHVTEIGKPATDRGPARSLAFSADGKVLAVASPSLGLAWFWDTATGQPIGQSLTDSGGISGEFVLGSNGDVAIAAGSGGSPAIQLWNVDTGLRVGGPLVVSGADDLGPLVLSPDGTLLAAGGQDGTVRLWSPMLMAPASATLASSDDGVFGIALAYSPEGTQLSSVDQDGTERLHSTKTGRVETAGPAAPVDAAWTPCLVFVRQNILVGLFDTATGLSVRWWNTNTGSIRTAPLPGSPASNIAFHFAMSPDGSLVAAGVLVPRGAYPSGRHCSCGNLDRPGPLPSCRRPLRKVRSHRSHSARMGRSSQPATITA